MPSPKIPSAALLARRGAVIEWNKAAVDALYAGMADAMQEIGEKIIADASRGPGGSGVGSLRDPATAQERGVPMMLDTGYVTVWALGKLVYGSAEVAASKNKPRGLKVPADQVVAVTAFSSPLSHFAELGTVKEPARPFLIPAFNRGVPGVASVIVPAMGKRVKGVPASLWSSAPRGPRVSR